MALFLDVEPGDVVRIGADTVVQVERKSGQRTRIRIDSEYKVQFNRAGKAERPTAAPETPLIRRPIPGRG